MNQITQNPASSITLQREHKRRDYGERIDGKMKITGDGQRGCKRSEGEGQRGRRW